MTVAELRAALDAHPDDAEIVVMDGASLRCLEVVSIEASTIEDEGVKPTCVIEVIR